VGNKATRPFLGYGLGLRPDHYETILESVPNLDWFEIITENYLIPGGKPLYYLDRIREHYPMVMHGVSLSIGSTDPLDFEYLKDVKKLAERIEPVWISDHLCWTGVNGLNMHDLLPLPYTLPTIEYVVSQINQVQDFLGRRILIENVSSYLTYKQSEMTEWEFLSEIANRADCHLLFDVNNVYVSSVNHGFNPIDYLNGIPQHRVMQIHLAGHSNHDNYIIDTHDAPVIKPVWDLYAETIKCFGSVSTMIERDDNIPELSELLLEVEQARSISKSVLEEVDLA
jgi:uncharacterized protein (UPF0276 family)